MSKITTTAPRTIPQLGFGTPAIDVFWLNHSITFLPIKAASVGGLHYLNYLTCCCENLAYNRRVSGVHGRTRGSCSLQVVPSLGIRCRGLFLAAPLAASATGSIGESGRSRLLLAASSVHGILVWPGLGLHKHFLFRKLLLLHFRPQSKHDCGDPIARNSRS